MMHPFSIPQKLLGLFCALLLSTAVHAQNKVVAYVPNWINLNTYVNTIDYAKLTHINIAFENLYNDNGDLSFNTSDNALISRAHANGIKVCVSIGGGSASGDQVLTNRYFTQISASRRAAFVDKISAYISAHNFDGIDVDLEGPSINGDYGAFIQALSNKLKPQGKLVTAALSQGYGGGNVPNSVFQHLDFVNIMAYDGKGYWNPNDPGQHSSLDFAKSNTQYWLNRGLPKSKAVLGVPFYGYGFGAAFRNRDYPYKEVIAAYPGAENTDQVGSTIWYNGIPTIKAKTNYVFDMGIGGIMIWSLDYDGTGSKSLLTAIDQVFKARTDVPPVEQGPYNNVRATLPGKIEAENYDVGGQGLAYNDTEGSNQGTAYRSDGVDVQATTDAGGGYNIGWTAAGEWLEYSVNVATAGTYAVTLRTAGTGNGSVRLELDGSDISGTIALPATGGWQTWSDVTRNGITFTAGNHVLRLFIMAGGFNLNHLTVAVPPNQAPVVNLTAPLSNTSFTSPAIVQVAASASDADGSISKVEFFNGSTKLGEDVTAPYSFTWTNVAAGSYSITARATDNSNAATTSSAVSIIVSNPPADCPSLTWSDEFNGTNLDLTKWSYQSGDGCPNLCGWGNNELEYYTNGTNNVTVANGMLNITAKYQPNYNGTGKNYTSGKLITSGKFSQKYGRYEALIKLPSATGVWPAFWMLADNTQWPATGEIDILETANLNPTRWLGTLHYGTPSGGYQSKGANWTAPTPLSNDFHLYAVEWTTDEIRWYVDNVFRGSVTKAALTAGGGAWPFDAQKFYIILNVAVGGNFTGQTPVSSQYPVSMLVDYVRVYSGDPCNVQQAPYSGSPIALPGKLEAENYDLGGQGVAYSDTDAGNQGGVYRNDAVDVQETTDAGGGYNVGWTAAGEWLEYTVHVAATGTYDVAFRTAGTSVGALRMELDGVDVTGTVSLPNTGGWQTWATTTQTNVSLTAGQHILRLFVVTGGFNLNSITVSTPTTPVNQPPVVVLSAPSNNAQFNAPATLTISANASDADGNVVKVEFFNGNTKLGEDISAPYSYSWSNVSAGTYTLTARATDNNGAVTGSAVVTVKVNAVVMDNCSGVVTYAENNGYVAGSIVKNAGSRYQCKPWPYSGWCNGASWAYAPGSGAYWADAWTLLGSCGSTRESETMNAAAGQEALLSNAPNPFNGMTTVQVHVQETGTVSIKVYDLSGKEMGTVVDAYLSAGTYSFDFQAAALKAGVYLIKYTGEQGTVIRKAVKSE